MSLFGIELFFGEGKPMLNIGTDLIGIVWICAPLTSCILLSQISGTYDPRIVYGIMIFVFVNDAGAYFVGKRFGKTKLFPSISPNKTWEGTIGGVIISLLCYPFVMEMGHISRFDWCVIAGISIIFGSIGDLIESMFKRDLKIKDTGNILPGHGGVNDRIDSLLFTVPLVYWYLTL